MTDTSFIFRDVIQYKLQKLFCQMNSIHDKRRKKEKGSGKATAFLFLLGSLSERQPPALLVE